MFKNMRVSLIGAVIAACACGASARSALAQTPKLLPGTRPTVFATVQGNVTNPNDAAIPSGTVRLRDIRTGRVVQVTTTDKTGLFTFRNLDPGSYVVELMGSNQTTLATSRILNINAGEVMSAIVKVAYPIPPFAGLLGQTVPSAATVISAAAASGVLATAVTGQPVSSRQ